MAWWQIHRLPGTLSRDGSDSGVPLGEREDGAEAIVLLLCLILWDPLWSFWAFCRVFFSLLIRICLPRDFSTGPHSYPSALPIFLPIEVSFSYPKPQNHEPITFLPTFLPKLTVLPRRLPLHNNTGAHNMQVLWWGNCGMHLDVWKGRELHVIVAFLGWKRMERDWLPQRWTRYLECTSYLHTTVL